MSNKDKSNPLYNDQNSQRDKHMKDELNVETNKEDLKFNKEANSFELDVNSHKDEYDHPDPYDTSAPNGADFNSDWDEANPTAQDEYNKDASLENDLDKLGMHVDSGSIVELSPLDEELAKTDEDERDDLDEEGYPKNDDPPKP